MNQPNSINVSSQRANELFQGKAASTIRDMMVENSQLQAVIEVLNQQLQEAQAQLAKIRAAGNGRVDDASLPTPASPQSS